MKQTITMHLKKKKKEIEISLNICGLNVVAGWYCCFVLTTDIWMVGCVDSCVLIVFFISTPPHGGGSLIAEIDPRHLNWFMVSCRQYQSDHKIHAIKTH